VGLVITVFFTNAGSPATGLTPTASGWLLTGISAFSAESMTEIGGGFYYYDFDEYVEHLDYAFRADGGVALPTLDRYKYGASNSGPSHESIFYMAEGAARIAHRIAGWESDTLDSLSDQIDLITAKLPSKDYLTGTDNADGDVQMDESTGDFSATQQARINTEVDTALDTAIPASPTAASINDRVNKTFKAFWNKKTLTKTDLTHYTEILYDDDESTEIRNQSLVMTSATVETRGESTA